MFSPPISACSFDAAGTLIHLAEPVGNSYSRVASDFGIESNPRTVELSFRKVFRKTPPPFSPDSPYVHSNEKMWWRELVEEVFDDAGATWSNSQTLDQCFEALYDHFEAPGTWLANDGTHEILERISARYPCVVLSNFDGRLRRILTDLGLSTFFEDFFLSCEIGASKPSPRMFETVRNHFNLPAEQILHIGDDPVCDEKGAKDAGFQFFSVGKQGDDLSQLFDQLSLA
ncbi:MAG: HAD-IA family hydrolase [Verrucomicrobiales bacterium]|nr:HAD-IA family hydrolase [Verrucomicrobiales bacterium]